MPLDASPSVPQPPPPSSDDADDAAITALIGQRPDGRATRWLRPLLIGIAVVVLVAAGVASFVLLRPSPAPRYETVDVRRGNLDVTVSATGVLAPVTQVDVSSELSGVVESVLVRDNDRVRRGQALALLDTARLRDQIETAAAAGVQARASLAQARATELQTRLARDRLHRLYAMSRGGYPARVDVEAADANHQRALAGVASAQATIRAADASLATGRTNLAKSVIRSPINGVVLHRRVEPGQTVAASLQAPVLFNLAEDLTRMELHVDIDEADVAQVSPGQTADFTVDAFPGRRFSASVERVGLGSEVKDGVVTYTGVLTVDNADLSLRPGMTATSEIRSAHRPNVLLVPEAALRFTPPPSQARESAMQAIMPRMRQRPRAARSASRNSQRLWLLRDGRPSPVPVTVGATNGRDTEVSGPGLRPGLAVITQALDSQRRR
jgi:HlyD family secretion protein